MRMLALDSGMDDHVRFTRIVAIEIGPAAELGPDQGAVERTSDLGGFRHVHSNKRASQRQVANMLKRLHPIKRRMTY